MSNPPLASFTISRIIMMETRFAREAVIEFDEVQTALNLEVETGKDEAGELWSQLTVNVSGTSGGRPAFEAYVRALGVFSKEGETELEEKSFLEVNAPAIIFPFVREHIATLTLKAGVGHLLLPPVNFTKNRE